jgi:hypothetical protein
MVLLAELTSPAPFFSRRLAASASLPLKQGTRGADTFHVKRTKKISLVFFSNRQGSQNEEGFKLEKYVTSTDGKGILKGLSGEN